MEEDELVYSFTTKDGFVYHAYFLDYSAYHPDFKDVFTFNIEPDREDAHPIDSRIAQTIIFILRSFFSHHDNSMIMICDTLDGKELKRERLFNRWYQSYNDGNIIKYDASSTNEYYTLYVSLYVHKHNKQASQIVSAFYDLVKNNMYPL